jgi:hypothetical protein
VCHVMLCFCCVTNVVLNEASHSLYKISFLLYAVLIFNIKAVISRQDHLFSVQSQPKWLDVGV